ncbi:MAG TPA: glycerophosphodiester phosphodiesterase family protein [Pyrinomonadaceae bacterium]|nr:glycerophosphodiester phosphodiesterase family protein [Pyrinomonadaceae bacterium]
MLRPLIIAHRGASAVAPENTTAAFEAAIAAGADGIEFDVRLSRDGVPVIIHDDTLRRTHGMQRRVADMTLKELNKLDVPSVKQLFELFESNELILYLEIKDRQIELAEACCRLVEEYRLKDRVVFECFEHSALEVVKNIDPKLKTAALFQPPSSFILKRAQAIGAAEIALHHRLTNKRLIEKAKLANLKVVTWTVDDPAWIGRAQAHGIDALITNNPSALITARDAV